MFGTLRKSQHEHKQTQQQLITIDKWLNQWSQHTLVMQLNKQFSPSESHPYPLREMSSMDVINEEAVALCIGSRDSTQKLVWIGYLKNFIRVRPSQDWRLERDQQINPEAVVESEGCLVKREAVPAGLSVGRRRSGGREAPILAEAARREGERSSDLLAAASMEGGASVFRLDLGGCDGRGFSTVRTDGNGSQPVRRFKNLTLTLI